MSDLVSEVTSFSDAALGALVTSIFPGLQAIPLYKKDSAESDEVDAASDTLTIYTGVVSGATALLATINEDFAVFSGAVNIAGLVPLTALQAFVNDQQLQTAIAKTQSDFNSNNAAALADDVQTLGDSTCALLLDAGAFLAAFPVTTEVGLVIMTAAVVAQYALDSGVLTTVSNDIGKLFENEGMQELQSELQGLFRTSLQTVSPLELDLTGNGVQTIDQSAGAHFDYTGSGFAQSTGWAAPQDGLLVLPDAKGQVTQGSELFGNNTVLPDGTLAPNGFAALAAYDVNHDGVINASDPVFSQLRIWVGGNGQPGSGQLLTLAQAGIQSLNLSYATQNVTDANGNVIKQVGSYTLTNGTTRAMDDVWYSVNPAETVETNPVTVSATIAALPNLSGAGNMHSLQQAMARDTSGTLTGLVQSFVSNAGTMALAQARSAAEAILLDWTGADQYSTTSRGTYINGQQVYAVEAFMGQGFMQSAGINAGTNQPGPNAAALVQQAYGKLLDWTTAQLLAQTKFAPWLNEVAFTWDATTQAMGVDVSQVVSSLSALYGNDPTQGAGWMNEFAQSLKGMGDTGMMILLALQQQGSVSGQGFSAALATMGYAPVIGSASSPVIEGVPNRNTMLVGVGNETLVAGNGDDLLIAGKGQETLEAGSDNPGLSHLRKAYWIRLPSW